MLQVDNLHVAYEQSEILNGLEFYMKPAEIVAITGLNGMGKTTLRKAIMGIIPSTEGVIRIGDEKISDVVSHVRVHRGIGYVPQGRMIFSTMTVAENIETGLAGTNEKSIPDDIYEIFLVLHEMRSRKGGNLSGGNNSN